MKTYAVRVAHEGKWWVARATDFDHAVTQARRLSDVENAARDMIATIEGVDVNEVVVDMVWERVGDIDVTEVGASVSSAREAAEAAQRHYTRQLQHEARRLAANGLTVRDIGAVLSLSHQRAQQLLATDPAPNLDTLASNAD